MFDFFLQKPKLLLVFFSIYIVFISSVYSLFVYPKGDEVHYLITASSIVKDQDIWLENNYANHDYPAEYKTIDHHTIKSPNGHEVLYHGLGFYQLLISPGYDLLGKVGAVLTSSIFAILLAIQIYKFCNEVISQKESSLICTGIVMICLPLAQYSFLVFPEIIGAFLIVLNIRAIFNKPSLDILTAVSIGIMPWIHVRFFPPAVFLLLVWILKGRKMEYKKLSHCLVTLIIFICYFVFLEIIYGDFMPTKPYQVLGIPTNSGDILVNWINMLFDRQYGLFIYSPIFIFSLLGFMNWYKEKKTQALIVSGLIFSYLIPVATYYDWNGGYSPPARYLVPIIGLLVPAIGFFLRRNKNQVVEIIFYLFGIWSISAFFINLSIPGNHGFVFSDGISNFLWFMYQHIGVNIHHFFPAYFPEMNLSLRHYLWIILTMVFMFLIRKLSFFRF
ncbi:MAG: hypothetical protein Q7R49_04260 [Candidatus Daviesbacteria bacterium]|nr:hypothetical protein [Candidatus Daviesbacteria bacterium]